MKVVEKYFLILGIVFPCILNFCSGEEPVCPQSIVDGLLAEMYEADEKALILMDLDNIRQSTFNGRKSIQDEYSQERPLYIATAGGPGASKSTILETFMVKRAPDSNFVYVDPDRVCLRSMINTYIRHLSCYAISKSPSYHDLLQEAYAKWRGASNYIALTLLNEAARKKLNIAHGTTSTSPHIASLYKNLRDQGYKIVLILCGATYESPEIDFSQRKNPSFCTNRR